MDCDKIALVSFPLKLNHAREKTNWSLCGFWEERDLEKIRGIISLRPLFRD